LDASATAMTKGAENTDKRVGVPRESWRRTIWKRPENGHGVSLA
jgi:hypothetical protein